MKLGSASGLGRHIDLTLPSNRNAIVGGVATGVVHGSVRLLSGSGVDVLGSTTAGAAVFLAWALTREIDPENDRAATLSMLGAAPVAVFAGMAVLPIALALLAVRMIVGTTGRGLAPADFGVALVAGVVAGVSTTGWPTVPFLAVGVWLASPRDRRLGLVLGAVGGLVAVYVGDVEFGDLGPALFLLAVGLLALGRLRPTPVRANNDVGRLLDVRRIFAGRSALAMIAVVVVLLTPAGFATGLVMIVPLVTASFVTTSELGLRNPSRPRSVR